MEIKKGDFRDMVDTTMEIYSLHHLLDDLGILCVGPKNLFCDTKAGR